MAPADSRSTEALEELEEPSTSSWSQWLEKERDTSDTVADLVPVVLCKDALKSSSLPKGAAEVRLNSIVDRVVQSADHVKARGIGCPRFVRLVCFPCRLQLSFPSKVCCRDGRRVIARSVLCTASRMHLNLLSVRRHQALHDQKMQPPVQVSVGVINAADILFDPPLPVPMTAALGSMMLCRKLVPKELAQRSYRRCESPT